MKRKIVIALFVALLVLCLGGTPSIAVVNYPPVSAPNGPYTGFVGIPITLDGSASYDPDEPQDFIISWEWDIDNDGQFDDASGETVIWTWFTPYSGVVSLRVTDSFGETDEAIAIITVEEMVPGTISGAKFEDINGNKARDPGEGYIPGWIIKLKDEDGNLIAETTTDSNGEYTFDSLTPGTYQVHEEQLASWTQTLPDTGYWEIQVSNGENVEDVDFGNQHTAGPGPSPSVPSITEWGIIAATILLVILIPLTLRKRILVR